MDERTRDLNAEGTMGEYNKEQPKAAGKAIVTLLYGLGDGLDMHDTANLMGLIQALSAAADEFKGDTDAAIGHALAGAAEEFGDRRMG